MTIAKKNPMEKKITSLADPKMFDPDRDRQAYLTKIESERAERAEDRRANPNASSASTLTRKTTPVL